jgi:hypothetical protein
VASANLIRRPSLEQLLDNQVGELDQLIGEVRAGIRSAPRYDELERRATSIANGIRDAFRKGRA